MNTAITTSILAAALAIPTSLYCCAGAPDATITAQHVQVAEARGKPQEPKQDARPYPDKIALLIAIQNYPEAVSGKFGRLQGPLNDIALVEQTLRNDLGFPAAEIHVLRDQQATHEAIVREFDSWLIQRAGPKTEVLFWFCGHGSRVPDLSGEEEDGLDSSFLAYDSRSDGRDGSYDLIDDELNSLLNALTRKTQRITLVTDACHAGSSFRGGIERSAFRGVPAGHKQFDDRLIQSFWPTSIELLEDDAAQREQTKGKYFQISACTNRQRAWEIEVESQQGSTHYGGMSYFLVQAMKQALPDDTYYMVARRTEAAVSKYLENQNVTYEGAADRVLFGGKFRARPAGFPARVLGKGKILVEAGYLHGLVKGGILEVFGARGESLGKATIDGLLGGTAHAVWQGEGPARGEETPIWVRLAERPKQLPPLRVFVSNAELRQQLTKSTWLELSDKEKFCPYRLTADAAGYALKTSEDLVIWAGKLEPSGDFEAAARKEIQHRALWDLANVEGSYTITAHLARATTQDLSRYRHANLLANVNLRRQHGVAGLAEYQVEVEDFSQIIGRLAMLEVTNLCDHPAYIAVLMVGENREVTVMWPRNGERDNRFKAGERQSIPLFLGMEPQWRLERPMRERYLVIATSKHVDFEPFISKSTLRFGGVELPGVLGIAMDGNTTRGGGSVPVDRRSWGITGVDLLVSRRN